MFKIEILITGGVVVGSFKVALNISLADLSYWVEEAVRAQDCDEGVIAWQCVRPDGRTLCRVKVQGA